MPDKGAQDKTEKPTPRRRRKAREEGQVAKSQEINSVAVLLGGLASLYFLGGFVYHQLSAFMRHLLGGLQNFHLGVPQAHHLSMTVLWHFLKTVLPIWAVVFLAALLVNIAQVGFMMAPKKLKPNLSKLNPISGLKKFFSMGMLVELFKNIGKLTVVGVVAYVTVSEEWPELPKLGHMEVAQIVSYIVGVCFKIFWRCILAMIVLAVLDWAYQKYKFEKDLKMSKQEVKDEYKQQEGDPQVKARIRQIQREQAQKRMMNQVPGADVVLTNPTHLAVALAYRMEEMEAPEVVAKGAGRIAERIKETAREHGVPVIEDKPLAQALYRSVEVGQSIPAELYEAVATILAHVYRIKNKHRSFMARRQAGPQGAG